jgi:peptide/nickel transport system substrate-binding protein
LVLAYYYRKKPGRNWASRAPRDGASKTVREDADVNEFESLQRNLSEGRIGRREFIKRATALGFAAAIPAGLLAEEAKAAAPKQGGKLRQALRGGSNADTLFGVLGGGDTHQINTQWQILSNVTEVTPNGEVIGELAESWEVSDDATEWVFKLRKGVEFHNGKSLEAEDVVHSINVHRGEDSRSIGKGLVEGVDDVKADGKETVIFKLKTGNADFPFILASPRFSIAPAGSMDADWEKGIGTGPFILAHWEPGVRSATKRNPNYFKEGLPYFDEVETIHVADVGARTSALRDGTVDVIDDPEPQTLHLLEQVPNLLIREVGGNSHYTFPMLMDTAPFDNIDVRSALKYAINREAMLQTLLRGHGYLGNDHPISKAQRFFASELPQRRYDPDKAKFHLKQAGLSELDVTLWASEIYAGGIDSAVLYKEHAAKAGINITVEQVPTDGYWSEIWNVKPFCVSVWYGQPTEDMMLTQAFSADSAWNETHWNNERFEKLLVAARAELDNTKRREMYVEMQQLIRDEGGFVAPVFRNWLVGASNKVYIPEKIAGDMPVDGNRNTQRWSFA